MKNKLCYLLSVISIGLLFIQVLIFPVASVSLSSVNAIDIQENQPELDGFSEEVLPNIPKLKEIEDLPLSFSTIDSTIVGKAGENIILSFHANKKINEATVKLPEEARIVEEDMPVGVTIEESKEANYWVIHSEKMQETFTFPVVFEEEGSYEAAIDEAKVQIYIQSMETISPDEQGETNLDKDESTEAEESKENKDTATGDQVEIDKAVSYISPEEGVAEVTNWTDFGQALGTPSITTIEVTKDFEVPTNSTVPGFITGVGSNPSGGAQFVYLTPANSSRKLVVNGNGHHIDFGSVSLVPMGATHNAQSPWDITFNDATIYSGNWWGFWSVQQGLSLAQQQISRIALKDVSVVGNQMLAPYYTHVDLYGKIDNHVVASYSSPFRTNFAVNTPNSINIESRSLTIKEDAVVNFSTLNSGNVVIGVGNQSGSLTLEKNATFNLESNGTLASANANAQTGSSIDIANGNLIMDEGSTINIDTTRNFAALTLRSTTSTLEVNDGAKFNIESTNHSFTGNGSNRNLVSMNAGSSLLVGSDAELNINAEGRGSASSSIIYVAGAANFKIAKDGSMDIKSDSNSINQNLLFFASANSIFEFSDAKKVNLERTNQISGSVTNGLINITGSTGQLDIDVQSVKQWNRDNFTEEPDYFWTPIFNLILRYNTINPTITNVSSIFQETMTSFNEGFTTRNVQRILFEKIPDVEVNIDPLTEDPMEVNSYTITGKASPHSVIRFSGDPAIPDGEIQSPNFSETDKYHVTADENGDYLYELPKDSLFTEGNEVTAYAYLNGKSATASTVVEKSRRPPNPKDPMNPEIEVDPENKPELEEDQGLLSIDFASRFTFGQQAISTRTKRYYAQPQRLLNPDGTVNEAEERPNYIQISDRRPEEERHGWQLAVTQNSQFTDLQENELRGARLSFTNQQLESIHGSDEPMLYNQDGVTLIPGEKTKLLTALNGQGAGTWIYRFGDGESASESVALEVPPTANPRASTYETTLTWELSVVPDN
ncbi:WxL domain-containing protein [Enterococcus mundtii]|uniref:WxL domain-containing protein n=1 Tax=Enterococcus mundtii TaxID=53346 RepID=UPI0032DF2A4E